MPRRKAIPERVKVLVRLRQCQCCAECWRDFSIEGHESPIEYDHRPPLILRPVNAAGTDYEPPQNDPPYIEALHEACHQKRTTGRLPGAERTITVRGSDAWLAAKFRRIEGRNKKRPKAKIPSRKKNPWPKRKFQ